MISGGSDADLVLDLSTATGTTPSDPPRHRCSDCGKTFRQSSNYRTHLKSHGVLATATAHACGLCGREFLYKNSLRAHAVAAHGGGGPIDEHACPFCPKRFAFRGDLAAHANAVHTKKDPLPCDVSGCGRVFYHRTSLRAHKVSAHGGRSTAVDSKLRYVRLIFTGVEDTSFFPSILLKVIRLWTYFTTSLRGLSISYYTHA